MYVDNELLLSDEQALVATAYSTNTIDLAAKRKVWRGRPVYVVVTVDVSFAVATSYEIQVVISENANLSSHKLCASTGAIVIASLTAGRAPIVIPLGNALDENSEKYLGLQYVEVGSTENAGKVTAFIALEPQTNV